MLAILFFGILFFSFGVLCCLAYLKSKEKNIGIVRRINDNNVVIVDIQGVEVKLTLTDEQILISSKV